MFGGGVEGSYSIGDVHYARIDRASWRAHKHTAIFARTMFVREVPESRFRVKQLKLVFKTSRDPLLM